MIKTLNLNKTPIEFQKIEKKFQKIFLKNRHPSWMFIGKRGVGKSFVASKLACYVINECNLNISNSKIKSEFIIKYTEELTFISPLEKSKSGMISKEQIDHILIKLNSFSLTGGWRVFIIDKLNLSSNGAMNAMLKIIEEPPKKTVFFFIVDDISKVSPTISSRCQKLFFNQLSKESCNIILQEKLPNLNQKDLNSLIILSDYSPGFAIELFNLSAHCLYSDILNAIFDRSKIITISEKIYNSSKSSFERSKLFNSLLKRFIYILSMNKISAISHEKDFILNEFEVVERIKEKFSITNILDILNDLNKRYKRTNNYNTNSALEIYQVLSKLN